MEDVKAVTRIEAILNGEDITPVTREEAILSGADVEPLSREEYFVQKRLGEGGGGGLEYVIPEQSFGLGTAGEAELHDVIFEEGLIIVKYVLSGFGGTSYKQYNYISDEEGTGYYPADPTDQSYIDLENGKAILHGNSGTVGTISAIRGF